MVGHCSTSWLSIPTVVAVEMWEYIRIVVGVMSTAIGAPEFET